MNHGQALLDHNRGAWDRLRRSRRKRRGVQWTAHVVQVKSLVVSLSVGYV